MYRKLTLAVAAILVGFAIPVFAHAQDPDPSGKTGLVPCGSYANDPCEVSDLFDLVIIVTNFMIGMAGIIAVFVIMFAGYSLVVAAGNIEAVTASKKLLVNGVIGFFFIMAAFVITNFLIFGGREIVPGESLVNGAPIKDGKPAGLFICPVDYILGNKVCGQQTSGGGGAGNTPGNAPGNNPQMPFQIPPGSAVGATEVSLDVNPPPGRESCTIKQTAWLDSIFLIKRAFAQRSGLDCGSVADGFLAGPRHNTYPSGLILQQDLSQTVGNPQSPNCSTMSNSGCGVVSLVHAIKMMQNKGYSYAGSWTQAWINSRALNPPSNIATVDWWIGIMQANNGYWYCGSNGAAYHSMSSDVMKNGQILRNVTAFKASSTNQVTLLNDIKRTLDGNGVAIALVKGPPFNTGNRGNHYILVYGQYYAETDGGKLWFKIADSNKNAQIGQVRFDVLQRNLTGMTGIYPTSPNP